MGQALIARRMGKTKIIAETGAGQHGVATATACALFNLDCEVFMGAEGRKTAKTKRRPYAIIRSEDSSRNIRIFDTERRNERSTEILGI